MTAADLKLAGTVERALRRCGLAVVSDGPWFVVVSAEDVAAGGPRLTGRLSASELARWADGWLACWRVWDGCKAAVWRG